MEKLFGIPMGSLAAFLLIAVGVILLVLLRLGWNNRVMVWLGLRNIPRRRAQTALIVFGLMLSTLIVAAAFGTGDTMTHSFRSLALDDLGEVDEVIDRGGGLNLVSLEMESDGDVARPSGRATFFRSAHFESLVTQVASQQAAGDPSARLIEALTPVIKVDAGPVINRTARQSEPSITVMGYDPATADVFDELYTLDGERVTVAELGKDEVYLNQTMADQLAAEPGHELEVYGSQTPSRVVVKAVVKRGGLPGQLILPLDRAQTAVGQPGKINGILVSNVGGPYDGAQHSAAVSGLLKRLTTLQVQEVKWIYLFGVELIGSIFTTMFIGFGSFSIAAALLLIFLIFVMLAAERQREMGMARAVGTRRRHLVQMFLFEGTAYDLVSAAVGALLGAGVGLATVGILARIFEGVEEFGGFQLRHHLEPRSLIVAYCLGMLLTFLTVTISSWRVSRLNIVSAIRELPPPSKPDEGPRVLVTQGTALVGLLFLIASLGNHSAFFYSLGVSLILIGVGLIIRRILHGRRYRPETRDRIAFSFAGISLLVFWSLPLDARGFFIISDLNAGPEMFVLSGIMMIAGAVWTIIYNADLLLALVTRLLSPFGSLLPVVRTAIAYPMNSKFRTGLTIAMFALVLFMLVFMSVFTHIISQAIEDDEITGIGDYDIEVSVSKLNPIPDLAAAIAAAPELNAADYEAVDQKGFIDGRRLYRIKLADGVDAKEAAQALESAFLEHGVETVIIEERIQEAQSMMNSILGLLQAFMGLGLVVGSTSIGIISTRAVVERRQQIGVLRAIGYRSWMIQWSFLLEASFVALLGILIGIGLGLILAYNFYNGEIASSGPGLGFSFVIPWTTLGIIVAVAYAMSMLTTYLPSWQAARIYPAEALRYE